MNKIEQLVYFGAGEYPSIKVLKRLAEELYLIDASQSAIAAREHEAKKFSNVFCSRRMVAVEAGSYEFYEYNSSRFNSIVEATADDLFKYRSLKLVGKQSMNGSTIQTLIDELELLAAKKMLIVDLGDVSKDQSLAVFESAASKGFQYLMVPDSYHIDDIAFDFKSILFEKIGFSLGEDVLVGMNLYKIERAVVSAEVQAADQITVEDDIENGSVDKVVDDSNNMDRLLQEKITEAENFERLYQEQKKLHLENKEWAEGIKIENENLRLKNSKALEEKTAEAENFERLYQEHKKHHLANKEWAENLKSENDKLKLENSKMLQDSELINKNFLKVSESLSIGSKLNVKLQNDIDQLRFQYSDKCQEVSELLKVLNEMKARVAKADDLVKDLRENYPDLVLNYYIHE